MNSNAASVGRGRPRGRNRLNRDLVLATALEVAESTPDEDVSLREIARRLGVTPMALYNHIDSKMEVEQFLLTRLFERYFTPVEYDDLTSGPELVRRCNISLFGLTKRHPKIYEIFIDNAAAPEVLQYQEALYEGMARCGVPPHVRRSWGRIFGSFIRGSVTWLFHEDEDAWSRMEASFQKVRMDEHPQFHTAITAMNSEHALSFEAGLDLLIHAMMASTDWAVKD